MEKIRIAIDAGHSFSTAGKRSPAFTESVEHEYEGKIISIAKGQSFREHVANSGVADYLADYLESIGFEVLRTGFDDDDGFDDLSDQSINKRQQQIRNFKADYSISIHFNASGRDGWDSAEGIEVLYDAGPSRVGDGKLLAAYIQERIQPVFNQKNRGAKKATGLGMTNSTGMGCEASVLCELAFMNNIEEAKNYFTNPEAWKKYALAIADGLIDYLNSKNIAWEDKEASSMTPKEFIKYVGNIATDDMIHSGILASLTIAQACLESGYGKSGLATKGKALFGIKAGSSWKGKVYNSKTQECYDGVSFMTISAAFRAYNSWTESIEDHSAFLNSSSRYKNIVGETNYKNACKYIYEDGYATDPKYSSKLISLIEKYDLTQYDVINPYPAPTSPITNESHSESIKWLQAALNLQILRNHIDGAELVVDGKWGAKTSAALIEYFKYKKWFKSSIKGYYAGINTINSLK